MAQLLKPRFYPKFQKQFKKLHPTLQKKFERQLAMLLKNPKHPSLRAREMAGKELFEARLDYHNRFVYKITDDIV